MRGDAGHRRHEMTISRKFFSANVTLPAATATSLYELMRDSALHWGFEDTTLTAPSMDSITGDAVTLTPAAITYLGSDANVRETAAGGDTYKGTALAAGEPASLQDFAGFGVVDPNQVYLWNTGGTTLDIIFQAR